MIGFTGALKVYLAIEPEDMRKSFNGLYAAAQDHLGEDPRKGALFVFCNKRRQRLSFSIPIRHCGHRVPMASIAWTTTARGPTQGTERFRDH